MTSPPRDELVIKVLSALKVPGVEVHDVIQVHRRYVVELMQQWTRLKEDEADFDLSFALVVDAELFRLDSVIRWLDTADGRLKRAEIEPLRSSDRSAHPPAARRPQMSYLELRKVSKSYGEGATEVHAVQDVDLAVERGSLVAVMGPVGFGQVDVADDRREPGGPDERRGADRRRTRSPPMSRNDKARLRRRTIGYVFQDFNLLAGLTAAENVSLPLELDGLSAKKGRSCRHGRARGTRPGGPCDALSRRAFRRGAPTRGDRPGGGRRTAPAARR